MSLDKRRPFFGVSLKMYFGYAQTVDWCERVMAMAHQLPALADGWVELSVFPSFAALSAAVRTFAGTPVERRGPGHVLGGPRPVHGRNWRI